MRKVLEALGITAILVLSGITWRALSGPDRLPDRIPIHFDISGQPNAWGSPNSLLLLAAVGVLIYVAITAFSFFPSAFNFPVRVTPRNREALEQLALDMIAWLKLELACLFAWIQSATIEAARHQWIGLSPILLPVAIAIVFGTTIWYFVAMRRAGR